MANDFVTAGQVSRLAVGLLTRSLVLPMTVLRNSSGDFAGDNGDSVTIRVPVPGAARTQASAGASITYDDITEVPVTLSLSHLYHATKIADEQLSLELVDFGQQVTQIQTAAVATGAEDELAGAMNDIASDDEFALTASEDDTEGVILGARQTLSEANVPSGDRFFAVSPDIATRVLSVPKFVRVNESGDDSALREAIIGRLYGFTFVESNGLTPGTAVAYHRTGFAMANRIPVPPRGAGDSASASSGGIGLRQIFQYDPNVLSDASVVSTFAGAAVVDTDRVVKLTTATS